MSESAPVILNVDDHEPGRYARSRLLTQAGYSVTEARNGRDALAMVAEKSPALVMLDVNLPDMSGLDVCRVIKQDPATRHMPVLHISASAITGTDLVRGLDNGADTYLTEPVEPMVLLATVRSLLRLRQAEEALQKANGALQRSNEDLERFAYAASHDLQEPLRTVAGFARLLDRRLRGKLDTDTNEFLDHILDGTDRMRCLIDDLLAYSQLGLAERAPTERVELSEALALAQRGLQAAIAEGEAEIVPGALPAVHGDASQLVQLLQNLLSNALKYRRTDAPSRVHLDAERHGGEWVVSVRDNGIGVPVEQRERIFQPFRRLHGREIPGTGIGLALCRRIVENHGGRIWVEPTPGEGATFRFTLRAA